MSESEIERLKASTAIGDIYEVFYHGTEHTGRSYIVTRFNEKSVWTNAIPARSRDSRQSWATLQKNINLRVLRKVV